MEKETLTETGEVTIRQTEVLELSKMSKGYNWKIKLLEIDLPRLAKINQAMEVEYGTGTDY